MSVVETVVVVDGVFKSTGGTVGFDQAVNSLDEIILFYS